MKTRLPLFYCFLLFFCVTSEMVVVMIMITALWLSYEQSSSRKVEGMGKELVNFSLQATFVHTSKGSSTGHQILRFGADGFNSSPKEGVLQIFYRPWLVLDPQSLGPMASTLTITPSRT
jgi:hypothetical protein